MDLIKAIRGLHGDLETLNALIAALEAYERTGVPPELHRRGRKSMGERERKALAECMKKYWNRIKDGA
jgi:hypothetical protein